MALCCGTWVGQLDQSAGSAWLRWLQGTPLGLGGVIGTAESPFLTATAEGLLLDALPFLTASDLLHVHHRLRC
jgi:hypothetical protein